MSYSSLQYVLCEFGPLYYRRFSFIVRFPTGLEYFWKCLICQKKKKESSRKVRKLACRGEKSSCCIYWKFGMIKFCLTFQVFKRVINIMFMYRLIWGVFLFLNIYCLEVCKYKGERVDLTDAVWLWLSIFEMSRVFKSNREFWLFII